MSRSLWPNTASPLWSPVFMIFRPSLAVRRCPGAEPPGAGASSSPQPTVDDEWEAAGDLRQGRETASVVQSVRFSPRELSAIRRAAKALGESTSEFIRRASVERVALNAAGPATSLSSMTVTMGSVYPSIRQLGTETVNMGPVIRVAGKIGLAS